MLLLIDGSSILNTQYFGNLPYSTKNIKNALRKAKTTEERESLTKDLENSYKDILQTSDGVYTNGVYGFFKFVIKAIKDTNPDHVAITWDITRDTFRRKISADYKENRGKVDKPLIEQFDTCIKMLEDMGVKQFYSKEYEADDYLGTISKMFQDETDIRILTKDHDTFQLVTDRTNIYLLTSSHEEANDLNKKHSVSEKIPDKTFLVDIDNMKAEYGFGPDKTVIIKALSGDTADNIHGVSGIGEKTAIQISRNFHKIEDVFKALEGKTEKRLKEDWKTDYGFKRSPIKYLLNEESFKDKDGNTKTAKEIALISEELATIKTDIDLNIRLKDLELNLDSNKVKEVLMEYEIKSISY